MQLVATLIYWVVVALWLGVLVTVIFYYTRNPRIFGTTRLLLFVVGLDTCRNIIENSYFGLFFGSQYGFFPVGIGQILGNPSLLIIPKLINIAAGCFVIGLLLMRWLPKAVSERDRSDQFAADLEMLATTDGLTSLANRRHFDTLFRTEWQRFQRYGRPLSLLVIDVDKFKLINDRLGHDAGDLVLKAVAETATPPNARPTWWRVSAATNSRCCYRKPAKRPPRSSPNGCASRFNNYSRVLPGGETQISVSIGVAGATLAMSACEVMLKRADEALYEAKRSGRNRVVRAPRNIAEKYQVAAA